jgi:N6-adenosine-specific RNA methylase IME4
VAARSSNIKQASVRQRRWRANCKRLATGQVKREKRESRMAALAMHTEKEMASLEESSRLYNVIYADPPWRFEPYSRQTGMDRAADNHYGTLSLDAIKSLRIPAASDCVLFLWATRPMLPQAIEVMGSWRFSYKTCFVWVKDRLGTGYWNRDNAELLLIGIRGDVPAPIRGEQPASMVFANRGRHSEKPGVFAELIEKMFPNVPRLEMFARADRAG